MQACPEFVTMGKINEKLRQVAVHGIRYRGLTGRMTLISESNYKHEFPKVGIFFCRNFAFHRHLCRVVIQIQNHWWL